MQIDHLIGSYTLDDGFTAHAFRCTIVDGVPGVPPTGEIAAVEWHAAGWLPAPASNILYYALPDAVDGKLGVKRANLTRIS